MEAKYFFSDEDSDEEKFFAGYLFVNDEEINFDENDNDYGTSNSWSMVL